MTSAPPATFQSLQAMLAERLPNYHRRPQQESLAEAIELTFAQQGADDRVQHLLAQAGTGTGKSLAALIAAILASHSSDEPRRYVVATATNALLTQYTKKDLPFLEEALGSLGIDFTWAPLKGISNFVCLSKISANPKIQNLQALLDELAPDEHGTYLHTGDRDDVQTPVDQRTEWPLVSASSDECPGRSKCPVAANCFALKHKDKAMEADIVATNTAVLLTDTKINEEIREASETGTGMHVLLGKYDGVIIDEAHELQGAATSHLGFSIKQGGLLKLTEQAVSFLSVHEDAGEQHKGTTFGIQEKVMRHVEALGEPLTRQVKNDESGVLDGEFITEHFELFANLYNELDALIRRVARTTVRDTSDVEREDGIKARIKATGANFLSNIKAVLLAKPDEMVRWAELYGGDRVGRDARWSIKTAPIEVGPYLRRELWDHYPAVLMSATMNTGTGHGFDYIAKTLGLDTAATLDVGSPFNYAAQARTFHPASQVPAPAGSTRSEWETWAPEATLQLVRAARGGAMLLYTSRRAMNEAYNTIGDRLRSDGYATFVQGGEMSNKEIAQRFRDDTDSVLFGLRSFMTGMDFPGETCRLVVVDKLPFAVPTDPIQKARSEAIEARGGFAFTELVVPSMTLTLQQAFGRLIRSVNDFGVVALMDSRLASKPYGREIVGALPPARVTTDIADVQRFFEDRRAARAA